jgi:hypothetical protein
MAVSATYREIAEHFGIGVEGARLKAKRRAAKGLWRIVPGNHPQDAIRVEVPEAEWATPHVGRPTRSNVGRPALDPTLPPTPDPTLPPPHGPEALVALVSQLHDQVASLTSQLVEAERARREVEKEAAAAPALRETVTTLRQALDSERQHKAEMRQELERARRPWWRRLAD